LSDYDLLAVVEDPIEVEGPPFIQLFVINARELESEVRRFNTVVLDAVVEGIILHDGLGIYGMIKGMVEEEIKRRGVKRDKREWIPVK